MGTICTSAGASRANRLQICNDHKPEAQASVESSEHSLAHRACRNAALVKRLALDWLSIEELKVHLFLKLFVPGQTQVTCVPLADLESFVWNSFVLKVLVR